MKKQNIIICAVCVIFGSTALTSCEEFFNQESDDVLYAEQEHLNNAVDTIYSVTGILNKMQTIADRTILLGEVRADLVALTNNATADLRDMANFAVKDDNKYNNPSDYYAIINNCNYFIAHADTALRSNRNENIFMKEYAAVKAIRAWTYLQLVLNYGQVPFVTDPLLSREEAELAEATPKADLQTVCSYFINDLATLPARYNTEYPGYRQIRGVESKLLFFPLSIVRGDLYLYRASATGNKEDYKQAALNYFQYISERNGTNSAYSTGNSAIRWTIGSTSWNSRTMYVSGNGESIGTQTELISMIAGDSIRAEGNYSELRNLFNSREENNLKFSISPSRRIIDISESQAYCHVASDGNSVIYAPTNLEEHRSGDLRLSYYWTSDYSYDRITSERIETQDINKFTSRNVHIYRRMMVYLRMAEALNMAGYPKMAFLILSKGLSNKVIASDVLPYYDTESKEDSIFLSKFDFNDARYVVMDVDDITGHATSQVEHNMMGIHSRGSGWTPMNEFYLLPNDTIEPDLAKRSQLVQEQQMYVDSLLLNEEALELAFEGTRFYDVMRYAMRQKNPGQAMAAIIGKRMGKDDSAAMTPVVSRLQDQRNWYLSWKGKIGY